MQLLNWAGKSQFHMSNSRNIAELVRLAANTPRRRVLHAVDEKALITAEIATTTNTYLDQHPVEFLLNGYSSLGETPWSVPGTKPMIVSMAAAACELDYLPLATYVDFLPGLVDRIVKTIADGDWAAAYPTRERPGSVRLRRRGRLGESSRPGLKRYRT